MLDGEVICVSFSILYSAAESERTRLAEERALQRIREQLNAEAEVYRKAERTVGITVFEMAECRPPTTVLGEPWYVLCQ